MGPALPVSIQHGARPRRLPGRLLEPPATPLGCDELSIAGGSRRPPPVELVDCVSIAGQAIAHAEIVLEGEILPASAPARTHDHSGYSMPEFLGYPAKRRAEASGIPA